MHASLFSWKSTALKQTSLWAKTILSLILKFELVFVLILPKLPRGIFGNQDCGISENFAHSRLRLEEHKWLEVGG